LGAGEGFQASGNGGPEPEPEQEEIDDDDIPAGGDPSASLGPPSPPSPTAEQNAAPMEAVVSPRPQARASARLLGKRRHREDVQLEDAVFLREPKPEPLDMEDVQPGPIGRSRNASSSEELFRELPPPQPHQNPEQIPGSSRHLILLSS
jgi:hypothetical protein